MNDDNHTPEPLTFNNCFDYEHKRLCLNSKKIDRIPFQIPLQQEVNEFYGANNTFTQIPACLFGCKDLEHLDLGNNQIIKLPAQIHDLRKLQTLDLSYNPIREIPSQIGSLPELQILDVSRGYFSEVPNSLGSLTNLSWLYLGNSLTSIPATINLCQKLTIVYLSNNRLQTLPETFAQLVNLEQLHLNNNRFTQIPKTIKNLEKLKWLALDNNPLNSLPWFVFEMPSLMGFSYCDICVPKHEARQFAKKCMNHGLITLRNRRLSDSSVFLYDS